VRFTQQQLMDKEAISALRTLVVKMATIAKSSDSPVFEVSGPVSLPARMRRVAVHRPLAGGGKVKHTRALPIGDTHAFIGGEKLRLVDVATMRNVNGDTELLVTFIPVDLDLAKTVASVTLSLDLAVNHLTGLAQWFEGVASSVSKTIETPLSKEELLQQQLEQDEVYGSW
jgi:hypothetical protein